MKNLIAAVLAAIPGMIVGVVLWTAVAACVVVIYWLGFVVLYQGVLCGRGRFGLGWCEPPGPEVQQTASEWMGLFTVIAFTWGEIFAAIVGAFCGGAMGIALVRVVSWIRRRIGRQ